MQVLDLTVVADRSCPTSRTYLTYLRDAGFAPGKVIIVDFAYGDPTYRKLAPYLGRRSALAVSKLRGGRSPVNDRFVQLCNLLKSTAPKSIDYFSNFAFEDYSETIANFVATDFSDSELLRLLSSEKCKNFLYTNGGRVPASFLNNKEISVLHIHPGVVPYVRGSDGLFWSLLVRGKPGASCFFMDAGIDTGRLILSREFDRPDLKMIDNFIDEDADLVSRALLHAYEPHLRAQLLIDVLQLLKGRLISELPAATQPAENAGNYQWMHRDLKMRVMKGLAA